MSGLQAAGTGAGAGGGFEYDGVRFRPAEAGRAPGTPTTVGLYHSRGGELWAEYAGAKVRTGRLVGTTRPDGTIDGAYCHVGLDGQTVAGTLVSVPERLPDGRIRLTENWRRADGSSGVSVIEQIGAAAEAGGVGQSDGVGQSAVIGQSDGVGQSDGLGHSGAPAGGPLSPAQLGHLRDAVYQDLQAHLGTADVLAAARCASRLLDRFLAGRAPGALTVAVAHDGDEVGSYTLAFVRAMQLITARVHGQTFTLRAVTGRRAEPSLRLDNIDRASQALGLHQDPRCEALSAEEDRRRGGVDAVIGTAVTEGGQPPSFSIGADTAFAPDAHRPLLAELLKFEFPEEKDR